VENFVYWPSLPAGSGERFCFGTLTIVFRVDFVDGGVVLPKGPGNPPGVRVSAGGSVRFGSRPVQKT